MHAGVDLMLGRATCIVSAPQFKLLTCAEAEAPGLPYKRHSMSSYHSRGLLP